MRYIDRRFLFPVAAATAWAQQPSPATAEAEAALRARAEQFFQLQVDKKYRPAEAMVAEDTPVYVDWRREKYRRCPRRSVSVGQSVRDLRPVEVNFAIAQQTKKGGAEAPPL